MTATVLFVPGLRDPVAQHWQTLLAAEWPDAHTVPPMGREDLDCARRVNAIEAAVSAIQGPVILVAHSGGCIMVSHWAQSTAQASRIQGALMATPPDFEAPMPEGYPTVEALRMGGWLPVPRHPLPFKSLVALSENDPLGGWHAVQKLAHDWQAETVNLGRVGHLNPASGYGPWPQAKDLLTRFSSTPFTRNNLQETT
ncbi:alpha/beta hydrolase [Limnohabitans sp. G3-2]|uniref:RBBP9/YdeN family alpha/beta hydrolase n=1 Tax=Limnohabitans sp. G3-2 TaxID=1100711 RepID=UPI000C1F3B2A|nr:alpha/beta fold hydrolase [Limnohabitans sp. G3-2]PIT77105.1 alpha/beta hydrolase [Limnohabitans sp. G3-2]